MLFDGFHSGIPAHIRNITENLVTWTHLEIFNVANNRRISAISYNYRHLISWPLVIKSHDNDAVGLRKNMISVH
jgi:hypothetical protein